MEKGINLYIAYFNIELKRTKLTSHKNTPGPGGSMS
jgi:hypothetical protein